MITTVPCNTSLLLYLSTSLISVTPPIRAVSTFPRSLFFFAVTDWWYNNIFMESTSKSQNPWTLPLIVVTDDYLYEYGYLFLDFDIGPVEKAVVLHLISLRENSHWNLSVYFYHLYILALRTRDLCNVTDGQDRLVHRLYAWVLLILNKSNFSGSLICQYHGHLNMSWSESSLRILTCYRPYYRKVNYTQRWEEWLHTYSRKE